jgi:hypothetical protein
MQSVTIPFSPQLAWKLGDDGTLWFGTTDDYRLVNRTLSGDTLRIVDKEWTALPVRPEDRTEWLELDWVEDFRRQGGDIDPDRIPATRPAWAGFWLDDRGYLWVRPARADAAETAFDVFDPEGRYLGEVSFGTTRVASAALIRGDRVYFVTRDEMDVPYVVVGRLAGRD